MVIVVRMKGKEPGTLTEQKRLRRKMKECKAPEKTPFKSIIPL
jgi:hypothetical protein